MQRQEYWIVVLDADVAEILTAPTLMRQRMPFLNQNGTNLFVN
jgi:hypothetical protein